MNRAKKEGQAPDVRPQPSLLPLVTQSSVSNYRGWQVPLEQLPPQH